MRHLFSWLCLAPFASFSLGCSVAPDVSNVTRLDVAGVVRHIECEARVALIQNLAHYLANNLRDESEAALVRAWLAEPDPVIRLARLGDLSIDKLYHLAARDETAARYLTAWDGVVIGFGYTFDISEQNNNSGGLNFAFPAGLSTIKLDASAGLDKIRQNKKSFTVVTSVPLLMQSGACLSPEGVAAEQGKPVNFAPIGASPDSETIANVVRAQLPNPIYPITGSVGMSEVLETFAGIWRGNAAGQARSTAIQIRQAKNDPYGLGPGNLVFEENAGGYTQVLTFTTKLSGKIEPTIEVTGSRLTKGTLKSDNLRSDKHELIIKISAPSPQEMDTAFNRLKSVREKNAQAIRDAIYRNAVSITHAAAPGIIAAIDSERRLLAFERLSYERVH